MPNMLVSHEVPLNLLKFSRAFNDYDYCLTHLCKIAEYNQFFHNSLAMGRKVLLDNSAYELGDGIGGKVFVDAILDLWPTWYVIPDCRHDQKRTMAAMESFQAEYKDLPGFSMGVMQGQNYQELEECYRFMRDRVDKISIPFDSAGFDRSLGLENMRPAFFEKLKSSKYWKPKPVHLLGAFKAKEFASPVYNDPVFETLDTSNPITAAMEGWRYGDDGLDQKSTKKLCMNKQSLSVHIDTDLILYNVKKFKDVMHSGNKQEA